MSATLLKILKVVSLTVMMIEVKFVVRADAIAHMVADKMVGDSVEKLLEDGGIEG